MKKLFYSVCLVGVLASCNNEGKTNELKEADDAKITAAYEEMNAAEMQKVSDECVLAVNAAAQSRLDSFNALPKVAQTAARKVAAKKVVAPVVDSKPKFDSKGNQVGTPGKDREDGKNAGNKNVKLDSKGNQVGTPGKDRD